MNGLLSSGFQIQQTSLPVPANVWQDLSLAMQREKHILGSRVEPENLRGVYEQGLALLLSYESEIIGFFAAWPVGEGYSEFGSLWVAPAWRGRKISDLISELTAKLPGLAGRIGFAVTQNPLTISAISHAGLEKNSDWGNPVPWELTCGPCDKFATDEERKNCPFRNSVCWLCVRSF